MSRTTRPEVAPPDEDPNAILLCSSPPCFMHELDPTYLGYLGHDEVIALLWDLLAVEWSGTVLEKAWLRAMLRRHLASRRGASPARHGEPDGFGPVGGEAGRLASRLQEALPRLQDHALRDDLQQVLGVLEREQRRRGNGHLRPSAVPDWPEVLAWRRAQRQDLLARRLAIAREQREAWSAAITARLVQLPALTGQAGPIAFYWPFKGEYDPRPLARSLHGRGLRLALPVVVERAKPMTFREWWPGMRMRAGVWNIPVPDEGDWVRPEILLVPLLGFDAQGYRLGYGGGYYDRTLTAMPSRPLTIGIGFGLARLETIYPQPHDVPMDMIITEERSRRTLPDPGRSFAGSDTREDRW